MTIISPQTLFLLSLSKLKGVGPAALKKVAAVPRFESRTVEQLATAIPQIARSLEGGANWSEAEDWANAQVASAERYSARILSPLDNEYPKLLAETKDDPFILYVQGSLAAPGQRSVAVIGTREPTQVGAEVAKRITTQFGHAGWSIVSGLAIGCDALAHQAALECGAHTVAVLAHGLHMIAPSKHKKLSLDILTAGGALVSEYPFGQAVQSQQYVKRDRTQAGMALGVVMIQSDIKGGSLYASRASLEYGRWLAVPYPTNRDLENSESKVQANVVIANGPPHERADLLRTTTSALNRVIILRSRDDIARLGESDGVRPFEHLPTQDGHLVEVLTSTSQLEQAEEPAAQQPELEPSMESSATEVEQADSTDDGETDLGVPSTQGSELVEVPLEQGSATPSDATRSENVEDEVPEEVPSIAAEGPTQQVTDEPAQPNDPPSADGREPDVIAPAAREGEVHVVETKVEAVDQRAEAEQVPRFFLSLVPPKDSSIGAAFGLWSLPKPSTKAFKERLGNARDDAGVREFYARHKRLQAHLAKLQRSIVSVKKPRTHDQKLALRLDGEEIVLHLVNLALASAHIEGIASALRRIEVDEDWIKRESEQLVSSGEQDENVSESRSRLVEELSEILKSNLQSYVIDDADSNGADSEGGSIRRLSLDELVKRLNSVMKAVF